MSLRNPWSRWKSGTFSLIAAAAAVYAAERLDPAQLAKKSPVIVQILNEKSGKCITVEEPREGAYIKQFNCNKPGVTNQWIKENSPEVPYFTLKVKYNNRDRCIGVDNGSPLPNINLRLFTCDGKANQKWKFDGNRIKNYDQLCIGVNNASIEDNANLRQFACDNNANQQWFWVA